MPPTRAATFSRAASGATNSLAFPKNIVTRSRRVEAVHVGAKRKAANSPPKDKAVKRSALGDLTNAAGKSVMETKKVFKALANSTMKANIRVDKKEVKKISVSQAVPQTRVPAPKEQKTILKEKTKASASVPKSANKPAQAHPVKPPKPPTTDENVVNGTEKRRSNRLARLSIINSAEESSLYVSALDDSSADVLFLGEVSKEVTHSETIVIEDLIDEKKKPSSKKKLPAGVEDFDAEHLDDPNQVANYAHDIFEYLKSRESQFIIRDYMEDQIHLNRWMRSLLVDWMVEVQENFELNHETLYLAVKLVDMYLSKVVVRKENLQLVGAASVFIASKFDERIPPLVDDLIFICDGAYTHHQLIKMEVNILKTIGYELGVPLSYRFLRRYARCAHIGMPQLTLARFILELALMEYNLVTLSDSKLGAAALLLALRMQNISSWTPTLQYYSGYKVEDIKEIVFMLNDMLHKKPKSALMTVRNKYSHKVFFEVAKVPLIQKEDIFTAAV